MAALGRDERVAALNAEGAIPDPPLRTIVTGFAEPLGTWADMSRLLPREAWPEPGPAAIAYFRAPAPDGATLDDLRRAVRARADGSLTALRPGARGGGGFDDALLHPPGGEGLSDQHLRLDMRGSERCVLSTPGSVLHRLAPDESGFDTLWLAGDWTRCGLDAGCVAAATIPGRAAAPALSGHALPIVGAEDVPARDTVAPRAAFLTASASGPSWPPKGLLARGEMTGWALFRALPREEVEALPPPGLHLGHTPRAAPGTHPVGLSFCRCHGVRGSFVPDGLAMSPYGEATFAIPYLRTAESARALPPPAAAPRRRPPAIGAGQFFQAMDERRARFRPMPRRGCPVRSASGARGR